MASESKRTVLVALAANLLIALAKLVGGLVSGSSSMLAEAAHSVADTINQLFLLASLKVAARPADPEHPFGYGKARFFWSLLAAVGIFVAGAVFSIYEGVHTLLNPSSEQGGLLPYVVLGVAFLAEGSSFLRALQQVRREAQEAARPLLRYLRESKDPTVKTVLAEDSAAVLGLLLAAVGIGLHRLTGQSWWDGAAAIAIGLLLAVVALLLGRENGALLIGEGADPELVVDWYDALRDADEVEEVVEMLTMYLGPDSVLLAARLDFRDDLRASQVEDFASRMEGQLGRRWPQVQQVFLDPTRSDPEVAARTRRHFEGLRRGLGARS
ncbi:MAG: cation diffusion facilitator family transporter [Actinomycetes bacterium]